MVICVDQISSVMVTPIENSRENRMDKTCPDCGGDGEIKDDESDLWVDCGECDGKSTIPEEYHKKCHDCGRFLKKERWVSKDNKQKAHGLCNECLSHYDYYPDY